MKRITKITEKVGKILLILMLSISQFSFPLEVLADELNNELEETVQEGLTEIENTPEVEDETTNQGEEREREYRKDHAPTGARTSHEEEAKQIHIQKKEEKEGGSALPMILLGIVAAVAVVFLLK